MGYKRSNLKKMSKDVIDYLTPKYVYIPLASGKDENVTTLVKKGDYVAIGTVLGKRKGANKVPIHSSVSGHVVGIVKKSYVTGKTVRCVKIENDEKETYLEKVPERKINEYTKEEFLETILDTGIVGLGGDGFPTYIKYNTDKKIHTLIVNAVECEPYLNADTALMLAQCEEILETVDAIMEINHIDRAIIAVSRNNTDLIHKLNNFIGTYLNIQMKIVDDVYPNGWERILVRELCHTNYKEVPLEKGIVVNNVSTIFAIYEALKYHKPMIDRVVSFTGDGLKKIYNVRVKIGTLAQDVITFLGGYQAYEEMLLVAGGPLMGTAFPTDEIAISPEINCILALPHEKEDDVLPCIRCGKCAEACPAKLSPTGIDKAYRKKNKKQLEQLEVERCIGCGLCSYVCPSNRNVRKQIALARQLLREEEV